MEGKTFYSFYSSSPLMYIIERKRVPAVKIRVRIRIDDRKSIRQGGKKKKWGKTETE